MNGDILTTLNYRRLIQYHRQKKGMVTIAMSQKKVQLELGVMEYDRSHRLTRYLEKPTLSYSVSMGIYVFEKKVMKWIPRDTILDFPQLIQKLSAGGKGSSAIRTGFLAGYRQARGL